MQCCSTRSRNLRSKATQPQASVDHFENHIRPFLTKNCISCHGQTKREGNLDLSSIDGILRGGDSGPAIVAGNPDESLVMEAVRHQSLEMPPDRKLEDKLVEPLALDRLWSLLADWASFKSR
ncbi:MAG: c-type cytochrome domain-containing protein [Pirellulales bacterium]